MEHLKFRRQYILTNQNIKTFENWNSYVIPFQNDNWTVYVHPDLEIEKTTIEKKSILLIGYVIDPDNPIASNKEIISKLIKLNSFHDIVQATDKYNGRFVMVYADENAIQLFNDATGFREVYYTFDQEKTYIASTPNLLKEILNLTLTNKKEIIDFRNSNAFRQNDSLWLGFETLVENVKQLPTNYSINLKNRQLNRFWPHKKIQLLDVDSAAEKLSHLLNNYIAGACNRYKVHLGITAGYDTRLIMACSINYKDKIDYYTNRTSELSSDHRDITIAKQLADILGVKLNLYKINDDVDKDFEKIFYQNNLLAHPKLLNVFYHGYIHKFDDYYNITGAMGNGLARKYISIPIGKKPSINTLLKLIGYKNSEYAYHVLSGWLSDALPICRDYNMDIMDLYQMEQDNAHWGALTGSEQNIIQEEIRPFNSRELIHVFWSLNEKYRYQYYPVIYRKIIKKNWPDALSVPINPSVRNQVYKFFRLLGIEQQVFKWFKLFKYYLS